MRYWLDEGDAALWLASAAIVIWLIQYTMIVDWWRNSPGSRGTRFVGITIAGLAICLLLVYIPSLLALAWPAKFAGFAATTWYHVLALVIVNATVVFMLTRIATWEYLRRQRRRGVPSTLPRDLVKRVDELEAENAELRERLGQR